jgi:predicted transcriptional regulator
VKLCREELNWKKSTTYTMLKKLEIKKIFINKNSIVSSLLSEEELYAEQSRQIVEEGFDGSLPRFLTAFTRDKKLTSKEIRELERLIDQHRED